MNEEFEKLLDTIPSNKASAELFSAILKDGFKSRNSSVKGDLYTLDQDIAKQKQRLKNGREMVLDGDITAADYKIMKVTIEEELEKLEAEKSKLTVSIDNHGGLIEDAVAVINSLKSCYQSGNAVIKQRIVGSIFPEKLIFEKTGYRTPKTLSVIQLLGRIDAASEGKKKGKNLHFVNPSLQVVAKGFKPLTF